MYSLLLSSKERVGTSQNHRGFFPTHSTFLPGVQYQPLNLPFFLPGASLLSFFRSQLQGSLFPSLSIPLFSPALPSLTNLFSFPFSPPLPSSYHPVIAESIDKHCLFIFFGKKEGRKEDNKKTTRCVPRKKSRDAATLH